MQPSQFQSVPDCTSIVVHASSSGIDDLLMATTAPVSNTALLTAVYGKGVALAAGMAARTGAAYDLAQACWNNPPLHYVLVSPKRGIKRAVEHWPPHQEASQRQRTSTSDFVRESMTHICMPMSHRVRTRESLGMSAETMLFRWDPTFASARHVLKRQAADPEGVERAAVPLDYLHVHSWNSGAHRGMGASLELFRAGCCHVALSQEFASSADPAFEAAPPEAETATEQAIAVQEHTTHVVDEEGQGPRLLNIAIGITATAATAIATTVTSPPPSPIPIATNIVTI